MSQYSIGIDVGGTKTAYGLFDQDHNLCAKYQHPTYTGGSSEEICFQVVKGVEKILQDNHIPSGSVKGAGLGFPSYIHFETGEILCTSNIPNLKNFKAQAYFQNQLNFPVILDNDSNVAALAEHRFGAGKGSKHMLYCAISTGIANGIIINNQLFRGSYGTAGETGHMLSTPEEGILCGCGNKGCFMSHTSGSMITQHIRQWLAQGKTTLMLDMAHGCPDCIDGFIIEKAALQGDAMAIESLEKMSYYLGIWLYNLYQAFNINCYVFGGGLVKMGDLLFDKVRYHFDKLNQAQKSLPVFFRYAQLSENFGIIGAEQLLYESQSVSLYPELILP